MNRLALILTGAATLALAADPPPGTGYSADGAQSRLEFIGSQAGAPLRASFHRFTATIDFSPAAPGAGHIDVLIEQASVDSQDQDRDATMKGADVFDVAHWPTAHYLTSSISKVATGFHATGALTLRGVTRDVPIDFEFTSTPGGAKLEGSAALKRLDFGVGQGDWKSTEWIGDDVKIHFALQLQPRR